MHQNSSCSKKTAYYFKHYSRIFPYNTFFLMKCTLSSKWRIFNAKECTDNIQNPIVTTCPSTSCEVTNHPAGKFSTLYGPQGFITRFKWSHHYIPPWIRGIQSAPSKTNYFWAILKLSSHIQHLYILSDRFPSAQGAASLFLVPCIAVTCMLLLAELELQLTQFMWTVTVVTTDSSADNRTCAEENMIRCCMTHLW